MKRKNKSRMSMIQLPKTEREKTELRKKKLDKKMIECSISHMKERLIMLGREYYLSSYHLLCQILDLKRTIYPKYSIKDLAEDMEDVYKNNWEVYTIMRLRYVTKNTEELIATNKLSVPLVLYCFRHNSVICISNRFQDKFFEIVLKKKYGTTASTNLLIRLNKKFEHLHIERVDRVPEKKKNEILRIADSLIDDGFLEDTEVNGIKQYNIAYYLTSALSIIKRDWVIMAQSDKEKVNEILNEIDKVIKNG